MGRPKGKNPKVQKFAKKKGILAKPAFKVHFKFLATLILVTFPGLDGKNDKYSVDDIMAKAEEFMDQLNFDMAQKFCHRALEIDPDHVKALEVTASLLLEVNINPRPLHHGSTGHLCFHREAMWRMPSVASVAPSPSNPRRVTQST